MKQNASRAFCAPGCSSSRVAFPSVPARFFTQLARLLLGVLFLAANGIVAHAQDPAEPAAPELHVVGVYEGENSVGHEPALVHVNVNRAGKTVVLFLSAYDPVIWQLNVAPGTTVQKVYASGYYPQRVQGLPPGAELERQSYEEGTSYLLVGDSIDSVRFLNNVPKVHRITGLEISSFQGAYQPIQPFVIDRIQDDPRLRSDYPQPVPPDGLPNLEFDAAFLGSPLTIRRYTLRGPADDLLPPIPSEMDLVADGAKRFYYGAQGHNVVKVDKDTGAIHDIPYEIVAPEGWPMGVAYDSKRDRVVVISLGSQGFIYHNNAPTQNGWAQLAELDGRDYNGLVYHAADDSLYSFVNAYEASRNTIHRLSPTTGEVLGQIPFPLLPFNISHDREAVLVSVGDYLVVLIRPGRWLPPDEGRDYRIYLVDPRNGDVKLTYRKAEKPVNRPPIVGITAPADGTQVELGQAVPLRAEAIDPDGRVVSVEFFANGQKIATGTSTDGKVFEATWTPSAAGTHLVTATATDDEGATGSFAHVRVIVKGNQAPTIQLLSPQSGAVFPAGATVRLIARALDSDGVVTKVEFFANGEFIGRGEPLPTAQPGLDPIGGVYGFEWKPADGSYTLTARATDNSGLTTTSNSARITVGENPNRPPIVQIMSPHNGATFEPGAVVRLLAQVFDPDGTIESVEFFANGRSIGRGTPSPDQPVPLAGDLAPIVVGTFYDLDWRPTAAGDYVITAVATDNRGGTGRSQEVRIVVGGNQPPIVQIVAPRSGSTFSSGAVVHLVAQAFDPGGTIASVEFFANGKSIGQGKKFEGPIIAENSTMPMLVVGIPYTLDWTPAEPGEYTLTAKATDNSGASATSPPVNIFVGDNRRPTVRITTPASGATFAPGAIVRIEAVAFDADGSIASVEFFANGVSIGRGQEIPPDPRLNRPEPADALYRLDWTSANAGPHVLTAKAMDNNGLSATSAPVPIVVEGNGRPVVQIVAPLDGASFAPGTKIRLLARAHDLDGTVASLDFYADGALIGHAQEVQEVPDPTADTRPVLLGKLFALDWTPMSPANYVLTAKATDNAGAFGTSSPVRIVVEGNRPPTVTIVSPENGASFAPGVEVSLLAHAIDAEQSIVSVEFFANGILIGAGREVPTLSPAAGFAPIPGGLYAIEWKPANAGTYLLTAKVTDRGGLSTTSTPVRIVVRENRPPTVRLVSPPAGSVLRANEATQLVAEAFDPDGIQSVEFFANDRSVGFAQNLGGILFRRGWTPQSAGTYRLHAKATDKTGATTLSGQVEVTVVDAPIVVLRNMPRFYRPGTKFRVRLIVDPGSSVLTHSVTDTPPAGWTVNRVTHGGTYDAATGTVKFGPFEGSRRRVLAYQLIVPETATGAQSFAGSAVADGVTQPIGGMQTTTLLPKLSGARPAGVAGSTPDR